MSVSLNLISDVQKHVAGKTAEAVEAAFDALLPGVKTNVALTVCNNAYIRKLNAKYRDKDTATDVLSFPLLLSDGPGRVSHLPTDIDPQTGELVLGDIIISIERAREQAEQFGHSLEREMCYLAVHAALHLVGYDHITEADKLQMRKKEEEILTELGLAR
jgi:probable rRNA maturation factor